MINELKQHCTDKIETITNKLELNRYIHKSETDPLKRRKLNADFMFNNIELNIYQSILENLSKIGHYPSV